ncbi:uncharacterized protein LOC116616226 [Nematostella vectensis]|uniref:uncharacterized protein LOC116616226 n=1 Tax=Nematostella vectensis TaxID=45351 RepID=UPI00138FB84E|nr:uncharacterized protein LOC116616226 [Nematostella vectensis]
MASSYARCERAAKQQHDNQVNQKFESMVKVLLYLETELQFKEELLELLSEDERVQPIVNEKLAELNKRVHSDPCVALGRDGLYNKEVWDERFRDFGGSCPQMDPVDHVVRTNSHHLGASAAMRCVELAEDQLKRYTETFMTLQKAAYSLKKMKQKLSKEKHRRSKDSSTTESQENPSEIISKLQENNKLLYDKLCWERERANRLENHVEAINATMLRDRRKSGYIIKVLVEEVEQITQQSKMQNHLANGSYMNGFHVETV